MSKHIVIIGPARSGKTSLLLQIAGQYSVDERDIISTRMSVLDQMFLFSNCTKDTRAVFIEEFQTIKDLELALIYFENGITVEKQLKKPFKIQPRFILTCRYQIPITERFNMSIKYSRIYDAEIYFLDTIESTKKLIEKWDTLNLR